MRIGDLIPFSLMEGTHSFALHPSLDPNKYQISDSLRSVQSWKAYTYVNNNADVGKGNFDKVGYVMISKTNNTIIPISRSDEHNQGFDLLWDMIEGNTAEKIKHDIDINDYVAVWPHGNNYIHTQKDIPDWLTVLKKFISYGGNPDGIVHGPRDSRGHILRIADFISHDGDFTIQQGKLAPLGQVLYDNFKNLAEMIRSVDGGDRIKTTQAFVAAVKFAKMLPDISSKLGVPYNDLLALPKKIKELQKENNIQGLDELFFGFDSLKNKIHINMKKTFAEQQAGQSPWMWGDITAVWGDVELAIDLLGRI